MKTEFKERKELNKKDLGLKIGFHLKAISDLMQDCVQLQPIRANLWQLLNGKKYTKRSVKLILQYAESLTIEQAKRRLTAEWLLETVAMHAPDSLDICDLIAQREAAKLIFKSCEPVEVEEPTVKKKQTPQRPKSYRFPRALNEIND